MGFCEDEGNEGDEMKAMKTMKIHRFIASPFSMFASIEPGRIA